MKSSYLLADASGRIKDDLAQCLRGLTAEQVKSLRPREARELLGYCAAVRGPALESAVDALEESGPHGASPAEATRWGAGRSRECLPNRGSVRSRPRRQAGLHLRSPPCRLRVFRERRSLWRATFAPSDGRANPRLDIEGSPRGAGYPAALTQTPVDLVLGQFLGNRSLGRAVTGADSIDAREVPVRKPL